MTYEERSAQVDKQIKTIVLIVIMFILIIIAAIYVYIYVIKSVEKGYDEQIGRCENGEYVGEREIDIKELSRAEMKEEELPEFNLYEETKEMNVQDRFKFYKDTLSNTIHPVNVRSSDVLKGLLEDDQKQWNALWHDIELEEEKKGNTENVAELNKLSSKEYWDIYELCYQAYCVLPQADMATRYGRNAGDALRTELEGAANYSQLIVYINSSYEAYVTSFHYRDCEQKLADGCFWIGDDFYQFLYHYAGLTEEQKEHCALMAYLYSFFGDEVSDEDEVQHRNDLEKIKRETRRILMEEYDYPAFLFSEG